MISIACDAKGEGFKVVFGQSGFWRLAQNEQGVWWFFSPDNRLEFLTTVTSVRPTQKSRDKEGLHYISRNWNGDTNGKKGDLDEWAGRTIRQVQETGFKGIGAWSHPVLHKYDVPVSKDLNLWKWAGENRLFYDPSWLERVEKAVKKQVVPLKNNRNLVGYYTDNELDWKRGFGIVDKYFNGLAPDNPNRLEVLKLIQSLWRSTKAFNKAWQTDIEGWGTLDNWATLPKYPIKARNKLVKKWRFQLAKDYFRITSKLILKYDFNHLILGSRYRRDVPMEVIRASKGFVHVQSVNIYARRSIQNISLHCKLKQRN
jgi:hypothetical protein